MNIIVASVSCIYGLGSPEEYEKQQVKVAVGDRVRRNTLIRDLVDIRYTRNDISFDRGCIRARGDVIEVFPPYQDRAFRIELFGDDVDRIREIDPNSFIQVCAAGRAGHYLATTAMMMGLHVRVGTEDTAYRFPHRDDLLDGNLEMVERAKMTAESLGRRLATAAEYREMLNLPPKP